VKVLNRAFKIIERIVLFNIFILLHQWLVWRSGSYYAN